MEKYGVQEDEDKAKTASTNNRCPKCGEELTQEGTINVRHCPSCGTLPFEEIPPGTPSSDP
jgi:NADH pyrophosphatase NudC (nudix superfamily)